MADKSISKPNKCSTKLRIIGKLRPFTDQESKSLIQDSTPWITVKNPQLHASSDKSTVSFDSQSTRNDAYELDYCYEQDEEIGLIYLKEVKPLISRVFDGENVSIAAIGARGSGKTYSIQGFQDKPGLAVLAMSDILSMSVELGKSIFVSMYELIHDHAYDILDPKRPEIQVMEDARGKINLKGLSQIAVKSISDFNDIYLSNSGVQKTLKGPMEHQRNHKGLMIHIYAYDDKSKTKKIHFVDLAGYEDPKKSSRDGIKLAEINRTNKSLYALLNVINSLKANEARLPFRESKFTRILQDSLGGTSHTLLLICLKPFVCQDTISSISLVSRSCRSTKQILKDSTNRNQSASKVNQSASKVNQSASKVNQSASKVNQSASKVNQSASNVKTLSSLNSGKMSVSASVKKHPNHKNLAEKKAGSNMKERKLSDKEKHINSKQSKCQSEDASAQKLKIIPDSALVVSPVLLAEAPPINSISASSAIESKEDKRLDQLGSLSASNLQITVLPGAIDERAIPPTEKEVSPHSAIDLEATHILTLDTEILADSEDATTYEENNSFQNKDAASPPLSERIREISNNLKSLCASTPLRINMPQYSSQASHNDNLEPKTPGVELGNSRHYTPQGTFGNRSAGVKHSLVQEYLKFLNSASKEELKGIKGIGEVRANYILELREESPEPFKNLDNLQEIGLSAKQIKGMMKQVAGELFN